MMFLDSLVMKGRPAGSEADGAHPRGELTGAFIPADPQTTKPLAVSRKRLVERGVFTTNCGFVNGLRLDFVYSLENP
jgi:hypothetical protein